MKELSIEEKAKRYDEVLAMAKECLKDGTITSTATGYIETIFPELKKSEDERIRKAIIDFLWKEKIFLQEAHSSVENNPKYRFVMDAIAWLEKQGADKVEPKFKVGDFLVNDYCMGKIVELTNDAYLLDTGQGIPFSCEHNARLWDIAKDAKDGDVLATEDWVFIFKKINSKREPTCYCHYDIELGFFIDTKSYIATGSEIYPATKEQRDTLMKAMADAGYTFDFKKNELKKVEPTDKYKGLTDFERTLADICIGWIGEELGWKQYIKDNADVLLKIAAKKFNSVQDVPFEQVPAWSEEDKVMLDEIIDFFENGTVKLQHDLSLYASWLKSLKEKYTWKPSEIQLQCLYDAIEHYQTNGYTASKLNELYEQMANIYKL